MAILDFERQKNRLINKSNVSFKETSFHRPHINKLFWKNILIITANKGEKLTEHLTG